jgi:hypothetical protein
MTGMTGAGGGGRGAGAGGVGKGQGLFGKTAGAGGAAGRGGMGMGPGGRPANASDEEQTEGKETWLTEDEDVWGARYNTETDPYV